MSESGRSSRLAQVESQVNYHRQRLELYVRLHTDKPCQRLTQLQEAVTGAEDRLAQYAEKEAAAGD
ncbi:MAG TPA: hypothetical protein VHZ75_10065 [Solirubrobacteraceae bacterium]|jgi:hypothetical protein|nr:hypothetical protein [Solirubrobacteraceae bacterium]